MNGLGVKISFLLILAQLGLVMMFIDTIDIDNTASHRRYDVVDFKRSDDLVKYFKLQHYRWPPENAGVPAIIVATVPQDIDQLPLRQKKALFFRLLLPIVLYENNKIVSERASIVQLFDKSRLYKRDRVLLDRLSTKYGLVADPDDTQFRAELLRRVDTIPPSLVLAQAVNESAWGSSRFSRQANNLFGEWTYKSDQGLIPKKRQEGARHFVRKFKSIQSSIASYMNNLNRGHAYQQFRQVREETRNNNRLLNSLRLANTLSRYSSKGGGYVAEIQSIIRHNQLRTLADNARLE